MKPEIIVMLTHNDVTVPNAREVFRASADLPIQYWGFKDAGVTAAEARALVDDIKAAGKTAVLEVVTFDKKALRDAAELAIEAGFDYFTGSNHSAEIQELVHAAGLRYFPFVGDAGGSPLSLTGTAESVADAASSAIAGGVDGIDLIAYRYVDGDPVALAKSIVERVGGEKVVIAGSVNSRERIEAVHEIGPFAYTMGGALFEGVFVPGGDFRQNLEGLIEIDTEVAGVHR